MYPQAVVFARPSRTQAWRLRLSPASVSPSLLLGLMLDAVGQLGDLVEHAAPFGHQLPDLALGMHDGGVVAPAELLADLRQAQVGELPAQVHRDLAGRDEHPA